MTTYSHVGIIVMSQIFIRHFFKKKKKKKKEKWYIYNLFSKLSNLFNKLKNK
jgi:hypothetical protein